MSRIGIGSARHRVVIVAADSLFRLGLWAYLRERPDLAVVSVTCAGASGRGVLKDSAPDIVILGDGNEPGGLELIKDIRYRFRDLPILFLSHRDEMLYAPRALRAGARGYLPKSSPPPLVLEG